MTPHASPIAATEGARVPRAVLTSTALQVAGRVASSLLQLAVLAILSRRLEAAEFGRLTFYLALFLVLDVVAEAGTATAVLERGATGGAALRGALDRGRCVRLAAALVALLAALAVGFVARAGDLVWIGVAALAFLTRPLELSTVVFQNRLAWDRVVLARSVGGALRLALVLLAAGLGARSCGPFLLAHAAGGAAGNLFLHLLARPELPARDAARAPPGLGAFLARALPLAATALLQQAYFYVDNLFVRPLAGDAELGRYNACVKLFSFALLVSSYLTASSFPWLVRRRDAGGAAELGRATRALGLPVTLAASAAAGTLLPYAGRLLALVFGDGFESAAPTLAWLLGGAVVVAAGSACLTALLALGRMRCVLAITAAGLAANALLNLALVPARGIEGSAIATVATEALVGLCALGALLASGARTLLHPAWLAAPALFALAWAGSRALAG
jgi:O-antigen/teichoic acid export membrane protein